MIKRPKTPDDFHYGKTPDGEDTLKKWLYSLKPTFAVAFGVSTIDVLCLTHCKTYRHAFRRYVEKKVYQDEFKLGWNE